MPQYLSPGVYVEEVPSAVQAIAGVGTSTAGFIGTMQNVIVIPPGPLYQVTGEVVGTSLQLATYPVQTKKDTFTVKVAGVSQTSATLVNDHKQHIAKIEFVTPPTGEVKVDYATFATPVRGEILATGRKTTDAQGNPLLDVSGIAITATKVKEARLANHPVQTRSGTFAVKLIKPVAGASPTATDVPATLNNDFQKRESKVSLTNEQTLNEGEQVVIDYFALPSGLAVYKEKIGIGDGKKTDFNLGGSTVNVVTDTTGKLVDTSMFQLRVGDDYDKSTPIAVNDFKVVLETDQQGPKVTFTTAPDVNRTIWADYIVHPTFKPVKVAKVGDDVKLCTSISEFKKHFGDFSTDPDQQKLAHAVFGFFHNGGTRCFVARMDNDINIALNLFGAIDEIAIVAAPGMVDGTVRDSIVAHCKIATQDRFAILDSDEVVANDELTKANIQPPPNSDYAAFYFPWIQVFDPASKIMNPKGNGRIYVPPSGHMAGIYARVDISRGVHKAPANESVMGALGLKYQISKAQQDGLNPQGVNCIRELNGAIRVWGARTVGGDANGEWRYINVRRTFLFLRESIDEGTQWAVFEPNDEKLWAKISRNVSAFLTTVWRSGALFGSTAAEAFYVKCDAETNPPELREVGQVVTEIGVAVVRPAEFVIFRISQWQPTAS